MEETILFEDPRAKVTTARVMLNGVTYSMANVTSVRRVSEDRPALVAFLGLLIVLVGFYLVFDSAAGLGLFIIVAGAALIFAFFRARPNHWVRIGTAGAEQNAVASQDPDWTNAVVEAVSQAMVRRG